MELLLLLQPETVLQKIQLLKMSKALWFSTLRKKKSLKSYVSPPSSRYVSALSKPPSLECTLPAQPQSPTGELTSQATEPVAAIVGNTEKGMFSSMILSTVGMVQMSDHS